MPKSVSPRSQFCARVRDNVQLCREHWKLVLRIKLDFPSTQPGQFVQIECRDHDAISDPVHRWNQEGRIQPPLVCDPDLIAHRALLRRPFSLAGRRDLAGGACDIDIIHRVVGVGTKWLAALEPGDHVSVLGPLGNRFTLPRENELAILIGGGVGIPPMLYLADALHGAHRQAVALVGVMSADLLPLTVVQPPSRDPVPVHCLQEFSRLGYPSVVSTDDGTLGVAGFVTGALQTFLQSQRENPQSSLRLYTCGPEAMMKRVAEIGAAHELPVQVAVERAMACGMGTCQSCCIRMRVPPDLDPQRWRYALACTDGPIFAADALLW